jgi:hypothetical protein
MTCYHAVERKEQWRRSIPAVPSNAAFSIVLIGVLQENVKLFFAFLSPLSFKISRW